MNKVSYYSLNDDGTDWYRGRGVFNFIKHKGISLTDISYSNPGSWSSICNCDTVILQRPYDENHLGIILQAKLMSKRVIADYDDNLLKLPVYHPVYKTYKENREFTEECIKSCDEIWVSTETLKKEFSVYNKNIFVIPNAHNDYRFPVEGKLENNPAHRTVFYRGGSTHKIDLFRYAERICNVAKAFKSWRFFMLGEIDNWEFQEISGLINNIYVANKIPLIQYFKHIYDFNSALAICPLANNDLNNSKSNISWIEATYCGSAFIGTKTLPAFNHDFIFDIDKLEHFDEYSNSTRMKRFNDESWQYIVENLLLSKINLLRIDRLLNEK